MTNQMLPAISLPKGRAGVNTPADMTPDELHAWRDMAYADLCTAAAEQPQSDWHSACFAALYVVCQEINRRGLTLPGPRAEAANDAIGAAK
jgi:hypothetical protein